jgi:hypothetical protein
LTGVVSHASPIAGEITARPSDVYRLHVITRDAGQAWAEADRPLDGFDPETGASVRTGPARSESEGQRRMLALHGGRRHRLEITPSCGPLRAGRELAPRCFPSGRSTLES